MSELTYIRVDNIEWDTDEEDVDLPTTVIVPVADIVDRDDLNERICDYLSDGHGWLVKDYQCKVYDEIEVQ